MLVLVLVLVLAAPAWPGDAHQAHAQQAGEGRRLYEFYCYQCHGYSGDGRTVAAQSVSPPPRDLTSMESRTLSRAQVYQAVRDGRPGTAMTPFGGVLGAHGVQSVVDYVVARFMSGSVPQARYHTAANGWPGHAHYAGAPLFTAPCLTCHLPDAGADLGPVWEPRAVSAPRGHYDHRRPTKAEVDAVSAATPYTRHMRAPPLPADADAQTRQGEQLFQANCAFCHAPDGSGRHWIGSFLEPRPRNLTDPEFMAGLSVERLSEVIRWGIQGTSMPAWRGVLTDEEITAIARYVGDVLAP